MLLAVSSPEVVLWAVSTLLLWSAVLCLGLPPREAPAAGADADAEDEHAGVLAGMRTVWRVPEVRLLVLLFGAQCVVAGTLEVFTAVVALEVLDLGDAGVGLLTALLGAGGVLGAAAAIAFSTDRRLPVGVLVGLVLWGLPLAVLGLAPLLLVALAAFAVVGAANTVMDVTGETLLQRTTPEAVLGRVFGVLETMAIAGMVAGAATAPVLVSLLGAEAALVVAGLALPAVAALSWPALARLRGAAAPAGLDRLRAEPSFALLPAPVLEGLARRLVVVEARAGDLVIAQGDVGDRWYVVDAGELEVLVDDRLVRTIGPGDAFGEIALLRDVPRTATVRALGDARLLALDREDFLSAVAGDGPVRSALDGVVRSRLGRAAPASASPSVPA
jgi:hypothetical protein